MRNTESAVDPDVLNPPWKNTITGRGAASAAGRQTLSVRQSSSPSASPASVAWTHFFPHAFAGRTAVHGAARSGARKRSCPTGGAAYGIPFQEITPPALRPSTAPWLVTAICAASTICWSVSTSSDAAAEHAGARARVKPRSG